MFRPKEDFTITNLASWKQLQAAINDNCKCIGVSGLPGTGKTQLMFDACQGTLVYNEHESNSSSAGKDNKNSRDGHRAFVVSVPESADSNEIARLLVLHLANAILGERRSTQTQGISRVISDKGTLISSAAAVVVGFVLFVLSATGIRVNPQLDLELVLVLAGTIGLLSWWAARVGSPRSRVALRKRAKNSESRDVLPAKLYKRAAELAHALEDERRFETTVTRGWTSALTTSVGLDFGTSASISKKILPMPLSELEEGYATLVSDFASAQNRLFICIDGLDKSGPDADIDRTLYELRRFLKRQDCRYLIALKESTEPGVSLRPRLIDRVVRCELLTFDEAKTSIKDQTAETPKRVLPATFTALCFTASGRLPADMVKMARFVADHTKDERNPSLASACSAIVQDELRTLSVELRSVARTLPSWDDQKELFNWAKQLGGSELTSDCILVIASQIRAFAVDRSDVVGPVDPKLQRVTHRAATLCYFCATLIDFFTDNLKDMDLDNVLATLDQLAEARRLIDLDTCGPAWEDISEFRGESKMPSYRQAVQSDRLDPRDPGDG